MPNTYINDSESAGELARLDLQERIIHEATKLLPKAVMDKPFKRVLDIGCGAGRWCLEMAFSYPHTDVAGIDISKSLVDYDNARARSQQLTNVSFGIVDALDPEELPFNPASFDLIHLRFGSSWLLPNEWKPLLNRCSALLVPGGSLVLTDGEGMYSSSSALMRFYQLVCEAMQRSGRSSSQTPFSLGFAPRLGYLLTSCEYRNVGGESTLLDFSFYRKTQNYQWRDNFNMLLHEVSPFLLREGVTTPEELATISTQALSEMFRPDFYGMSTLFTFYAEK